MNAIQLNGTHIGVKVRITKRNGAVYEDRIRTINHDSKGRMSSLDGKIDEALVGTEVTFESHAYIDVLPDETVEIMEDK